MRANVVEALRLTPESEMQNTYLQMYIRIGGNRRRYLDDLNLLITRGHNYWNSLLFDIIPFAISDVLQRPILIFSSHHDSWPILVMGENMRRNVNADPQYLQIALNSAQNHYYNVRSQQSRNDHIKARKKRKLSEMENAPMQNNEKRLKHEKLPNNQKNKPLVGVETVEKKQRYMPEYDKSKYKSDNEFVKMNRIFIRSRYDNDTFLLILYYVLFNFHQGGNLVFGEMLSKLKEKKKSNILSRVIHHLMTSATGVINKPCAKRKKKAISIAQTRVQQLKKTFIKNNEKLKRHMKIYSEGSSDEISATLENGVYKCCYCHKELMKVVTHNSYLMCKNCEQFFSKK